MRMVYGRSFSGTTEIDGQDLRAERQRQHSQQPPPPTKPVRRINGQRISFRDLAVMAFPVKTEANLAFVARVDPRTSRRWLADNTEPPAEVLGIILCEIMRRYHQRD